MEEFEIPENVNERTAEEYRELVEKAENEDYEIYNMAVDVR